MRMPCQTYFLTFMIDRKLLASVRARVLVDTLAPQNRTYTLPTRLDRGQATQGAQIRIDYIFVSQDIRVLHAEVVKRSPTDEVSESLPYCGNARNRAERMKTETQIVEICWARLIAMHGSPRLLDELCAQEQRIVATPYAHPLRAVCLTVESCLPASRAPLPLVRAPQRCD